MQTLTNISSDTAIVRYRITPWPVDNAGNNKCAGTPMIVHIIVEPTPTMYFVPIQDTICDNTVTDIILHSTTRPTYPVRFDYTVTPEFPDSVLIINTQSGRIGYLDGDKILEQIDNLSNRAQKVTYTVTPYTVTQAGAVRCSGLPYSVVIWVEPTPTMYFVPEEDTICDNVVTDLELQSITQPTLPVRFDYSVTAEFPDSVIITNTQSDRIGYMAGDKILERINNLSNRVQKVTFTATPYTVSETGTIRCPGSSYSIDIWVEPTPTMYFVPVQDTIM